MKIVYAPPGARMIAVNNKEIRRIILTNTLIERATDIDAFLEPIWPLLKAFQLPCSIEECGHARCCGIYAFDFSYTKLIEIPTDIVQGSSEAIAKVYAKAHGIKSEALRSHMINAFFHKREFLQLLEELIYMVSLIEDYFRQREQN